ncbi:MAG: TolC family outer membrane protein [Cellvibrionales bacterium]|jgi:outer membrane protein|nr:TolC family outer membrane protein [Cellvibrionales bacterium]
MLRNVQKLGWQKKILQASALALLCVSMSGALHAETLEQVFQSARQNDARLKSQAAQAAAGRETGNIYKAPLLPQAELGATKSKSKNHIQGYRCSGASTGVSDCDNVRSNITSSNLTVTQTLFNMEQWYDFQKGKKIGEQADAQYRVDEMEFMVRVVDVYIGVLHAIDTYQTALAQEKAIERQLEQAKQRFDVGLIAITDVQESQATFDSTHVETLSALGNIGIAFEAVEQLTGQRVEKIAPLSADLPVKMLQPEAQAEWEKLALENNPRLSVATLAVDASRENAKARRSAHLPTLYGSFQHSNSDGDINYGNGFGSMNDDMNGNTVALNLRIPLYSGGGVSAARRQAYQQQIAAEEQLTDSQRSVVQGARSYHLAVTTDIQRVAAQKQAIVSAQSALDATQAGYEVGTRNIVDLLDAEQRLYRVKLSYSTARYQFILDTLRLLQTAGTLTDANVLTLNQWMEPEKSYDRNHFK